MRCVAMLVCALALAACDAAQNENAAAPEAEAEAAMPAAYVGTWAVDAASCAIPQEQEGAPYVFHADGYDQHEAHCTWATLEETGPHAWHVNAACQVEGDEQSAGWDMSVHADRLTLDGRELVRCPETPPTP